MELQIGEWRKRDTGKVIRYAITGMHFDWYMDRKWMLRLYGRYFWYLEMTRATQVIAVYADGVLAGVLLAAMRGEKKENGTFWMRLYVRLFDWFQGIFAKGGAGVYDRTNQELLAAYCRDRRPDGEIVFLAADPDIQVRGIGTRLLEELERREAGKTVYLFTDNACTYQFYEHRGFERVGEKEITLKIGRKRVELRCFLYSKTLG